VGVTLSLFISISVLIASRDASASEMLTYRMVDEIEAWPTNLATIARFMLFRISDVTVECFSTCG